MYQLKAEQKDCQTKKISCSILLIISIKELYTLGKYEFFKYIGF